LSGKTAEEIWRVIAAGLAAFLIGLVLGHAILALLIFFILAFSWYFYNLVRLQRWLEKGKKYVPPSSKGLWDDVFHNIFRLQQRSRKRNKRIVKLLNRFRESTSALPDGVVVLDQYGSIEWWNDSAESLLGLRYPHDVGQRVTNLVRSPEFIAYFSADEAPERVVFQSPKNEEVTLAVRCVPYGNKQQMLLIRDITVFERVEQMRRDFVANISHEMRTPLTVMRGFLEGMTEVKDIPADEWQRSIELMQQQAVRMHRLVEDLMLLSRLESGEREASMETVPVPQLLTTLREEGELLNKEKKHSLLWDVDTSVYLRGNAKELDSVFLNLIVNAINYTPANGKIAVRWYADEQGAHFEVKDNGIGIAANHIPRLTERFYRVDVARSRESGGSGLGLAIVKHILSRHKAHLEIESTVGLGSTFRCNFPPEAVIRKASGERDRPNPAA
jgi:two-component system phosphate regulon sensor histidine kinase PhoR